jgi:hypothetical protein
MIRNTVKGVVFILIFAFLFIKVSYLLRPESFRGAATTIKEYLSLPDNSIDVVYIGASRVNRYWAPMEAYKRYGLVSANCTAGALPQQFTKYIAVEALRRQSPKLLIIALDTFSTQTNLTDSDVRIRSVTDSFRYSFERLQAIQNGIPNEKSTFSYHFDIAKYHSNLENLFKKNCWYYAFGRDIQNDTKANGGLNGYLFERNAASIRHPSCSYIDELPLSNSVNPFYFELIDFVKTLNLKVMFTVSPHGENEKEEKYINYMRRVALENGIVFLNGNEFFDEIGLDVDVDFNDRSHTNIFGAEKYTEWLCRYLRNHYDLPDRRGDYRYTDWDLSYELWVQKVNEVKQSLISKMPEELLVKVYKISLKEKIGFAKYRNIYQSTGWSGPEDWGTWTDGEKAVLVINSDSNRDLFLHLNVKMVFNNNPVDVSINNTVIGSYTFTEGDNVIPITMENYKNKLLTIQFAIKEPYSPKDLGLSEDARKLGIGVESFYLDTQ